MSKVYSLQTIQKIPITLPEAWGFFSKPVNLKQITPPKLDLEIISKYHDKKMYSGQIIEYTVKPVFGIPLYWMTEITHVQELRYFVDEQRFGPYSLWHHQHHFEEIPGGIEMTDTVHYKLPFWILGDMANTFVVAAQLCEIFNYRVAAVEKKFGKWNEFL